MDGAYLESYNLPGALKYAKDMCQEKSRATTTELIPAEIAERKNVRKMPPRRS